MTNWRKAAAWTGGAILLAALAGAVVLHVLVDPERLKEAARDKAQAAWGRDLSAGDVSLALWPVPALHAENVALSNAQWAEAPHFARADSLDARLELLPLLTGKVRLKSLDLAGLRVELETGADGMSNVPSPGPQRAEKSPAQELLNLTSLRVRDAGIRHRKKDEPAGAWRIDEATLDASPGLRDVRIAAKLARGKSPLAVEATLADFSRAGEAGATTDGQVKLDWGKTRLAIAGKLPIGPGLHGYAVTADLESTSLVDLFDFLGSPQRPRAAAAAHLEIREARGTAEVTRLDVTVGKLKVTGEAKLSLAAPRKSFTARLEAGRMDWAQTMLDLGGPVIPPLAPDQLFHDVPLAWPILVALQGTEGSAEVLVRHLTLRNGVELTNAKSRIAVDGDRLALDGFTTGMLGGTASGSMVFEGRRKSVKVDFHGTDLLLQRWFAERGSQVPLTGGPMRVDAKFTSTGNTMKGFAATVTGPITVRMGPAVWASKKAGVAEASMTNAFGSKEAERIEFECVVAALPFRDGVATGDPLVGFRTTATALITGGTVDLREQALDLGGRVKPRSGSVGLAAIAGDVKISGKLRQPKMALDPAGKPGTVARAAAAVATLGISAVGTAMADAADAKRNDPCRVSLSASRRSPGASGRGTPRESPAPS